MSFFNKNKERMMVTVVTIILIILIGVTSTQRMSLTKFEKIIGNVLTPVGKIFNTIGHNISNFFNNIKDISILREENKALKNRIAQLEEENRNYQNIIGRADYLKNEAALLNNTSFNLVPAQIIGKEPGNWSDGFTIDKGIKDGIKQGDTVIQGVEVDKNIVNEGIVGRVIDVGDNWSKIVTAVDELSRMSFKTLRTQDSGVVVGSVDSKLEGYRTLEGYLFDNKADVIKGDKLFTSGLGGVYIADIYIGEVEEVIDNDEDLMKRIKVKPAINFKKLYKVFVISK